MGSHDYDIINTEVGPVTQLPLMMTHHDITNTEVGPVTQPPLRI
jgi:hypothetical protein